MSITLKQACEIGLVYTKAYQQITKEVLNSDSELLEKNIKDIEEAIKVSNE